MSCPPSSRPRQQVCSNVATLRSKPAGAVMATEPPGLADHRTNPVAYAKDRLGVTLWAKQAEIPSARLRPPYQVLVKSAHSVGKTMFKPELAHAWLAILNPTTTTSQS